MFATGVLVPPAHDGPSQHPPPPFKKTTRRLLVADGLTAMPSPAPFPQFASGTGSHDHVPGVAPIGVPVHHGFDVARTRSRCRSLRSPSSIGPFASWPDAASVSLPIVGPRSPTSAPPLAAQ